MKKIFSLILIGVFCGALGTGCTKQEELSWKPKNKSQPASCITLDLKKILQLKTNSILFVIDADSENVLYMIVDEEQQELRDGHVTEKGEILKYRIGILNYKTNKIIWEKTDEENIYHSGILTYQGAILCMSPKAERVEENVQNYSIVQYQGMEEKILVKGTCKKDGYFLPYFNHQKDGDILFSWQNIASSGEVTFGVSQLDKGGNIINLFKRCETKGCSFLNSEFDCNEDEFLIFYEENGEGKFYIGDETGEKGGFALEEGEKLNSFCLLKGYVLLGISDNEDSEDWTHAMKLKDYQGEPWAIKQSGRDIGYYDITGNRECVALALNSLGEKFLVTIQQSSKVFELQQLRNLECEKGAAVLFNITINEWMAYYTGKNVIEIMQFD